MHSDVDSKVKRSLELLNRGPNLERGPIVPLEAEKGVRKFKPGDVVFFKRIKETSKPHGRYQEFSKGCGFGILLGAVPEAAEDPPAVFLAHLMGQIGYVSFDDVKALLSEEQMTVLIEKFKLKYYGPEQPEAVPPEAPSP